MIPSQPKDRIMIELALLLRELFPQIPKSRCIRTTKKPPAQTKGNKAKRKKAEYKRVQDLWKKGPSKCVKRILEEQLDQKETYHQAR